MFDPLEIQRLISEHLSCEHIAVEGDDGVHFSAVVVSAAFAGLTRVRQHRLVYDALGELMGNEIHALRLHTFTPEGWQKAGAGE